MSEQRPPARAPRRDSATGSGAPTGAAARTTSFGPLFFFCVGALAARLAGGLLPPFFSSAFDLAVYAGIALGGALTYRRFVRRALEDRRRDRARRDRASD